MSRSTGEDLVDPQADSVSIDQDVALNGELGPGQVETGDPDHGCFELVHGLFGNDGRHLGGDPGRPLRFLNKEQTSGLDD